MVLEHIIPGNLQRGRKTFVKVGKPRHLVKEHYRPAVIEDIVKRLERLQPILCNRDIFTRIQGKLFGESGQFVFIVHVLIRPFSLDLDKSSIGQLGKP